MAVTGGRITASIYAFGTGGKEPVPYKEPGTINGRTHNFPNVGTYFYQAPAGTTAEGITINSVIVLAPTGSNVNGNIYWTDSTPAQLLSNGS